MDVHTSVFPQVRALQLCAGIRCGPIPWLYVGCIEPAERQAECSPCSVAHEVAAARSVRVLLGPVWCRERAASSCQ